MQSNIEHVLWTCFFIPILSTEPPSSPCHACMVWGRCAAIQFTNALAFVFISKKPSYRVSMGMLSGWRRTNGSSATKCLRSSSIASTLAMCLSLCVCGWCWKMSALFIESSCAVPSRHLWLFCRRNFLRISFSVLNRTLYTTVGCWLQRDEWHRSDLADGVSNLFSLSLSHSLVCALSPHIS